MSGASKRRWQWDPVALAAIVSLAAVLRVYCLSVRGYWLDEVVVLANAVTGAIWSPEEAPLFLWLESAWVWWTRDITAGNLRIVSVFWGVLAPYAIYFLGRQVVERRVALLSALLMAASPLAIYYSHEIRPYTLFYCTTAALYACFLKAQRVDRRGAWLAYGVMLSACCATHLIVAPACVALGIYSIIACWREPSGGRPNLPRLTRFLVVSVLSSAVGVSWLWFRPRTGGFFGGAYRHDLMRYLRDAFAGLGLLPGIGRIASDGTATAIWSALMAIGLVRLWRERRDAAGLFLLLLIATLSFDYATVGHASDWSNRTRYLSHGVAPALILVALGLDAVAGVLLWPLARIASHQGSRLILAGTLGMTLMAPRLAWWLDRAQHPELQMGAEYPFWSKVMVAREDTLMGVISASASDRDLVGFDLVRRDHLPLLVAARNGFRTMTERKTRWGLPPLHVGGPLAPPQADGLYALLTSNDRSNCEALAAMRQVGSAMEVWQERGKHGSYSVFGCRVEFLDEDAWSETPKKKPRGLERPRGQPGEGRPKRRVPTREGALRWGRGHGLSDEESLRRWRRMMNHGPKPGTSPENSRSLPEPSGKLE